MPKKKKNTIEEDELNVNQIEIDISKIKPNPSNPRIIKDDLFEKLVKSIKDFPKMMELRPIIVDSNNMILGGNMRLKALNYLSYKKIPKSWIKQASDLTDKEKEQFIIKDNVGFGEWNWGELQADWDVQKLEDWGLDLPVFYDEEYVSEEESNDNPYTAKIEPPIYSPSERKPEINELFNSDFFNTLIKEIDESDIKKDEKDFLKLCATRHIGFNYSKIADFYAHSDKKTQYLMENSALIIIDFDKAIEQGFVKLSENIANQYLEDFGDE